MKIAAVQFGSSGDIQDNTQRACALISQAAAEGARLIVLPEATSQNFNSGRLDTQAQDLDGSFAQALHTLAVELGVTVVAGMFRPADTVTAADAAACAAADSAAGAAKTINRVFNTALVTGSAGPAAGQATAVHTGYDKIHTYDAFNYQESATVKPGENLCVVDLGQFTLGVATCYDIRFPEQFKALAQAGAQVIAVPFSWADGPGKLDQWRLLSATRALDCTSFIVAAGQSRPGGKAQAGQPSGPTGLGHSVIVAPNGTRLAEAGYEDEIIYADIDLEQLHTVRKQLPVLKA